MLCRGSRPATLRPFPHPGRKEALTGGKFAGEDVTLLRLNAYLQGLGLTPLHILGRVFSNRTCRASVSERSMAQGRT